MAYRDLRGFLNDLRAEGDLVHVTAEVDPDQEIGAICHQVCLEDGPALLFENVKGYDLPHLTNVYGNRRRIARSFGCRDYLDLGDRWADLINRGGFPPRVVSQAPCQEIIRQGDDPFLDSLPLPICNEGDAGPYITLGFCIGRDPDTGIYNAAPYRMLKIDGRHTTMNFSPGRDLGLIRQKFLQSGRPMPVAVAIGVDPLTALAFTCPFNTEVDEIRMAGGLLGEPLEMVKCRTIDLEVPATSEVILEGYILMEGTHQDGPFGEYHGYYGIPTTVPIFEITALTHRRDPIYQGLYIGKLPHECAYIETAPVELEIHRLLKHVPGFRRFHMTIAGTRRNCVLQIQKRFEGHGKMAALAALGTAPGRDIKTLIVVDEDIDPYDWNEIEWALSTRFNPIEDVELFTGLPGNVADPAMPREAVGKSNLISKIILDATKSLVTPLHATCQPSRDIAAHVRHNWERYGIPSTRKKRLESRG